MGKMRTSLAVVAVAAVSAATGYVVAQRNLSLVAPPAASATGEASDRGKVLYYRNPMGLPDVSPVPKKDSMGMDYIAVYAGEETADAGAIVIAPERIQRAGVRSEAVARRSISQALVVPGALALDERLEFSVTMRVEGFVEAVYAATTGQFVRRGEPLFRIYSPAILQAAADYRIALSQGQGEAGARKLRNFGVPENWIESLRRPGDIPLTVDWPAPHDGVLMTKNVVSGARVMPGDELYRLSDVSSLWAIAEVPEIDIARVAVGQKASVELRGFPGERFEGVVAFVSPELRAQTRTAQVRIDLPNPSNRLLHRMQGDIAIETGEEQAVLAAPESAIIESGDRQIVIVDAGDGRFRPATVIVGRRGGGFAEIRGGLSEGDKVVSRANFLIDAESNLQSALNALTAEAAK